MSFKNFELNNNSGSQAEAAVLAYLNRCGSAVAHPRGKYDTDIDWTTPDGEVHTVGVETINKWGDDEVYPYPFYNASTHKRARKILNGSESILFIVNQPLTRFMVVSGMHFTPSMIPVESKAWLRGVNGKFQRGDSEDPMAMATCPWGMPSNVEWCFKVQRRKTHSLTSNHPISYERLNEIKVWNGPAPLKQLTTLNGEQNYDC